MPHPNGNGPPWIRLAAGLVALALKLVSVFRRGMHKAAPQTEREAADIHADRPYGNVRLSTFQGDRRQLSEPPPDPGEDRRQHVRRRVDRERDIKRRARIREDWPDASSDQ